MEVLLEVLLVMFGYDDDEMWYVFYIFRKFLNV